jgi:hypothetical protein
MSGTFNLMDTKLINKAISTLNPLHKSALAVMSQNIINWQETVYAFKEITANQLAISAIEPGTPAIGVGSESLAAKFYEPKPIEAQLWIGAAELAKYSTYNKEDKEKWLARKLKDHVQKAILQTKNGMAVSALTTGTMSWTMRKQNGAYDAYTLAVGTVAAPSVSGTWGSSTKISAIVKDIHVIIDAIQDSGYGGRIAFYCGRDTFELLMDKVVLAVNDGRFRGKVGDIAPGGFQTINFMGLTFINDPLRYYSAPDNGSVSAVADGISAKYLLAIDLDAGHETINMPILNMNANLKPRPLWLNVRQPADGSGVMIEAKCTPLYIPVCGAIKYVQCLA